jgi:hypothetical protein
MEITRRTSLQAAAAAVAAASWQQAAPPGNALGGPRRMPGPSNVGLKFATMNGSRPDHKSRVSKQIGVNYAIVGAGSDA